MLRLQHTCGIRGTTAGSGTLGEVHDLTADTPLAGDQEVVCHNDLSPKNTVHQLCSGELRPVAFIDWDLAAPGARIHDIAHVCWQYLDLSLSTDIEKVARRMRQDRHPAQWMAGRAPQVLLLSANSSLNQGHPLSERDRSVRGGWA